MNIRRNQTLILKPVSQRPLSGSGFNNAQLEGQPTQLSYVAKKIKGFPAHNFLKHLWQVALLSSTLVAGLLATPQTAYAEGSKELTSSGGYRPYITWTNSGLIGGVLARNVVYVYAEAGEIINLGSSAQNIGSGRINYTKPNGTTGSCTLSSTVGRISTRSQEVAGPLPATGGYTPCQVAVASGETGIWQIDFVSPDPTAIPNAGFTSVLASNNWTQPTTGSFVVAWDVTVTRSGTIRSGRAYLRYLAANMGSNVNGAFNGLLYVLTKDGYLYQINPNGLDPFAFIFFSNNQGAYNTTTNQPAYRSFDSTTLPSGFAYTPPTTADTETRYTNKIFFNSPDSLMPSSASISGGSTWLYPTLSPPPRPTNVSIVGSEGTANQSGQGLGGTFQFNNPDTVNRPYKIILDLNQNNIFGDGNDRTLNGTASPGNNSVIWDGKDGSGNIVVSQNTTFSSSIAFLGGEVHFPLLDAESNTSGIIIRRLNGSFSGPISSPIFGQAYIYYDDSQMVGNGGSGGGSAVPPNPRNASSGVDSSSGAHAWGTSNANGFGNNTFIDTWAYAPEFSTSTLSITVKGADLQITKSLVGLAIPGQRTTYNLDITNANNSAAGSISNVVGASVQDILNSNFSNPSVLSCQVTNGTGDCGTYGFTGNTFNATVNLNSGSSLRFVIQATLTSSATGTITNSATVRRPNDIGDPVDQDSSGGTNTSETATVSSSIAPISGNANVLLVKRITAINGNRTQNPNDGTALNGFIDDSTTNDNNAKWPSNYLIGAVNGGKVQSGDTIEYTIYFINAGLLDASSVRICDRISPNQSFKLSTYGGTGKDIQGQIGTGAVIDLTAANDSSDRTQVYAANASVPTACNLKSPNTNGTVDIGITGASGSGVPSITVLPSAIAAGLPSNSYGLVRFTTVVP